MGWDKDGQKQQDPAHRWKPCEYVSYYCSQVNQLRIRSNNITPMCGKKVREYLVSLKKKIEHFGLSVSKRATIKWFCVVCIHGKMLSMSFWPNDQLGHRSLLIRIVIKLLVESQHDATSSVYNVIVKLLFGQNPPAAAFSPDSNGESHNNEYMGPFRPLCTGTRLFCCSCWKSVPTSISQITRRQQARKWHRRKSILPLLTHKNVVGKKYIYVYNTSS